MSFASLFSKCLDWLAINETRLHDIIADNEVSVDGYDVVVMIT